MNPNNRADKLLGVLGYTRTNIFCKGNYNHNPFIPSKTHESKFAFGFFVHINEYI